MSRPPTIIDVAREAGVSRSVVSRVLRGERRVSPAATEAVIVGVEKLGYIPNLGARSLKAKVSKVVGIVACDLKNPYYVDLLHGVYQAADAVGYQVIISSGHEAAGGEEAAVTTMIEFRVAGVILAGPSAEMQRLRKLIGVVPAVIEGRTDADPAFDLVTSDDRDGTRLIVEHLLALGHRRIVILEEPGPSGRDRSQGFRAAISDTGLSGVATFFACPPTAEGSYDAVAQILCNGPPPTAIACNNDIAATGAMSALDEAGFEVPHDVSVTGFDDISLARLRQFNLTTVCQDSAAIGRACFDAIHRRALAAGGSAPTRMILQPSLIVRSSTAPVRANL